jgi:hypothetical protein
MLGKSQHQKSFVGAKKIGISLAGFISPQTQSIDIGKQLMGSKMNDFPTLLPIIKRRKQAY